MATKKPITEKDKLQAKSVAQLKNYAKRVGALITDMKTGKPKTKIQLINSILILQRLGKTKTALRKVAIKQENPKTASVSRQTRQRERYIDKDIQRDALPPGKRTSATGRTYYERRANRSDVPPTMLGYHTAPLNIVIQSNLSDALIEIKFDVELAQRRIKFVKYLINNYIPGAGIDIDTKKVFMQFEELMNKGYM